jgi:hypothetical protein
VKVYRVTARSPSWIWSYTAKATSGKAVRKVVNSARMPSGAEGNAGAGVVIDVTGIQELVREAQVAARKCVHQETSRHRLAVVGHVVSLQNKHIFAVGPLAHSWTA